MFPAIEPESRRGAHTTRNIILIVSAVAVLCCGGLVVGGVGLFRSIATSVGPVHAAVNDFLTDLENGNTDAAYGRLCSATRAQFSGSRFAEVVGARPTITRHTIVNTSVNNYNGEVSASVTAALTYADGSADNHTFQLLKESGAWRICGQPY